MWTYQAYREWAEREGVLNAFWRRGDVDLRSASRSTPLGPVLNAFWRRGDVDFRLLDGCGCCFSVLNAFWRRGDVDLNRCPYIIHPFHVLNAFWRRGDVDAVEPIVALTSKPGAQRLLATGRCGPI